MTNINDVINQKIEQYAGAMEALAKGNEVKHCIHDWDFVDEPGDEPGEEVLVCLKCGYKLDATDTVNHMTMLESDLANTRAVWNECEAELAARDALIERMTEKIYAGKQVSGRNELITWHLQLRDIANEWKNRESAL